MTYHRIVSNGINADDSRESSASRDGSEDVGYGAGLVKKLDLRYASRGQSEENSRGRPRAREASNGQHPEQGQAKDAITDDNSSQLGKAPAANVSFLMASAANKINSCVSSACCRNNTFHFGQRRSGGLQLG
jgi:hypothetical protein